MGECNIDLWPVQEQPCRGESETWSAERYAMLWRLFCGHLDIPTGVTALLQCLLPTHLSQPIALPCPLEIDVFGIPIPVYFPFLQLFIPSSGHGRRDSQECCQEAFPTKHVLWWSCFQRCLSLPIKLILGPSVLPCPVSCRHPRPPLTGDSDHMQRQIHWRGPCHWFSAGAALFSKVCFEQSLKRHVSEQILRFLLLVLILIQYTGMGVRQHASWCVTCLCSAGTPCACHLWHTGYPGEKHSMESHGCELFQIG